MGFQLSPGVQTKEIDLSTSIPAVATSLGATVGRFTWGPAFEPVLCTSETDLVSVFGQPTNDTYPAFLSAAAFLKYTNSLQVVRVVDSGATNAAPNGNAIKMNGREDFDTQQESGNLVEAFYARYPGTFGNGISVEMHDGKTVVDGNGDVIDSWSHWQYSGAFEVQPDASNNEIAIAVIIDGAVVETYSVSPVEGAKDAFANNIFADEQVNKKSKYIWVNSAEIDITNNEGAQSFAFSGGLAVSEGVAAHCDDMVSADEADCATAGANWVPAVAAGTVGINEYTEGWDKFANADEINVSIIIAGGVTNEPEATVSAVQKYMVEVIAEGRKDCIATLSPPKEMVVNVGGAANAVKNVQTWRVSTPFNVASSYGTLDGNYKYTYDKYADTYRWIGFSADVAGLMAHTDSVRDAWWSPGGLNRGKIKGVVKLAYQPNLAHRDQLYMLPYGVNPICSFPGQGTVLWGDRTLLTKPSAFDRINVRRLFIILEKAIAISAKYFLFEFNNEFTQANFRNMVNPYLQGIKARQGMYDFYVKCDMENNTPEVIDSNQFIASIFIKPSKSINFITLNFVATKTGVEFSEVIGQV
jgi:phage tail sheath protein FI